MNSITLYIGYYTILHYTGYWEKFLHQKGKTQENRPEQWRGNRNQGFDPKRRNRAEQNWLEQKGLDQPLLKQHRLVPNTKHNPTGHNRTEGSRKHLDGPASPTIKTKDVPLPAPQITKHPQAPTSVKSFAPTVHPDAAKVQAGVETLLPPAVSMSLLPDVHAPPTAGALWGKAGSCCPPLDCDSPLVLSQCQRDMPQVHTTFLNDSCP